MRFPGATHLLLFGGSKERLAQLRAGIEEELCRLRLQMHPGKSRIYRTADGFTFLGWRIFPGHTRLVRGNVVRFRRRMRSLAAEYARGEAGWDRISPKVRAWIAHADHGDTWRLRQQIFQQAF